MSKKIRNIVGIRFGRLVVISDSSLDGNKQNNSKDNLQVMTASEHLKLHAKGRKNG